MNIVTLLQRQTPFSVFHTPNSPMQLYSLTTNYIQLFILKSTQFQHKVVYTLVHQFKLLIINKLNSQLILKKKQAKQ